METTTDIEPILGVVVITRNEASHVAACLESVLAASRNFPGSKIALVDSNSTDATVAIARRYPIAIYRYQASLHTAAAGRCIGFQNIAARYVLFVDGDCCIEENWLPHAISLMESDPGAAVIYGARREVFEGAATQPVGASPSSEEYGLGGNALYRSHVLKQVDGFNPYIVAEEEGELFGRIQAAGYHAIRTPEIMFTHYTLPVYTMRGLLRRHLRGLGRGRGQVLRLSIQQGLFSYHARRFNRYLFMLFYLGLGVVLALAGIWRSNPWFPTVWIVLGLAAFIGLSLRRRSLRSALYIVIDWVLVGMAMTRDFIERPGRPETFRPLIERMK